MPEKVKSPKKQIFTQRRVKSAKRAFSSSSKLGRIPWTLSETRLSPSKTNQSPTKHTLHSPQSKEKDCLSETTLGSNFTEATKKRIRLEVAYDKCKLANKSTSSPLLTKRNLEIMNSQIYTSKKEEDSSSETTLGSKLSERTKERIRRELGGVSSSSLKKMSERTTKKSSFGKKPISPSSQSTLSEESYVLFL